MNSLLKFKMLATNHVVDNNYLDQYIELIVAHMHDPKVIKHTQSHHIIPVSYYTSRHLEIDNSTDNRVNLSYKNHMLAHLYLSGCTQGRDRYKNLYAVFQLSHFDREGYLDIQNYDKYQQLYEDAINAAPNHRKGTKCSEETKEKMRVASKLRAERAGGSCTKGTVWVSNSKEEKMISPDDLQTYLSQ